MAGRQRRTRKRLTKFDKEGTMVGTTEQVNGLSTGLVQGFVQGLYKACTGCRARSNSVCLSLRLYIDD